LNHISLTINGRRVEARVEPRTSLADFLRDQQLLTGTHLGCEHGVCGACTLLLDGAPGALVYCLCGGLRRGGDSHYRGLRRGSADGRAARRLHRGARLQCGYCTPGMLITERDVVLRLPDADEQRVRVELSGNLCRCTGYLGIVRAIQRVLASRRAR
jgi:carbon-monoxide dehydrogenase small subunit